MIADNRLLATKLDNIFLEGRKLFSNIPRFIRGNKRGERSINLSKGSLEVNFKALRKEVPINHDFNRFAKRDTRSFAEVINSKKVGGNESIRKGKRNYSLSFEVDEEEVSYYRKAFVGITKELGCAYGMKTVFHEEGIFFVRVTPLGASTCLLEDLIDGETASFLK